MVHIGLQILGIARVLWPDAGYVLMNGGIAFPVSGVRMETYIRGLCYEIWAEFNWLRVLSVDWI
jgi:hypothetical protein